MDICIEAMEDAIHRRSKPDIFSADGSWHDNMYMVQLWKNVKYKKSFLETCALTSEASTSAIKYFEPYNRYRLTSCLDDITTGQFYFNALPMPKAVSPQPAGRL